MPARCRSPTPHGSSLSDGTYSYTELDENGFSNGCFVRPLRVSESARYRVRCTVDTPEWRLERRRGYVRPPRHLPCGHECAIADLGECGDRKCGNYRLGDKSWDVRPTFLDFCVEYIRRAVPPGILQTGMVYASLGSGQLLFDWQLLERLILTEGARLRAVHLIDQDYGGPKRRDSAVQAQRIFAGWYNDHRWNDSEDGFCTFRSFLTAVDFQKWVQKTGERAHVLLDCDAVGARKRMDVAAFRRAAMRAGGICLVLSNPAKRTAILNHRKDGLRTLKQEVYRRGEWRHRESVSCSRTRSRRRRRRRTTDSRGSRGRPRKRRR